MSSLWFDPNHYAWIPGTAYGMVASLVGSLAGWLAPRGRARNVVIPALFVVWGLGMCLLTAGIAAYMSGQPWGIWYGFFLPGCVGVGLIGTALILVHRRYREAETRRVMARDILT